MTSRRPLLSLMLQRGRAICRLLILGCWAQGVALRMSAAESVNSQNPPALFPAASAPATVVSNAGPCFNVRAYVVEGNPLLSTNTVIPRLAKYTGTNVSVEEMTKAAAELQLEYRKQGWLAISVAFVPEHITNGIVTLNVAQTVIPQIIVAGERYLVLSNNVEVVANSSAPSTARVNALPPQITNAIPPAISRPIVPATPEEMARARAALVQKLAELDAQAKDTRVHVISTNATRFEVRQYMIKGNSILTPAIIGQAITNIDGAYGTNVSFEGVARWRPNWEKPITSVVIRQWRWNCLRKQMPMRLFESRFLKAGWRPSTSRATATSVPTTSCALSPACTPTWFSMCRFSTPN